MSTKIEDGFEVAPPPKSSPATVAAPRATMTPAMVFSVIAIALFAGGLGFVGGMQVSRGSSAQGNMANGPGGNSMIMPQQTSGSSSDTTQTPPTPPGGTSSSQLTPSTSSSSTSTSSS